MKNLNFNIIFSTLCKIATLFIISIIIYITTPLNVPKKVIKLPSGSITNTINSLKRQGLFVTPIDKYLLMAIGEPKSGEITIDSPTINRIDLLKMVVDAKGNYHKITLIPGETKEIFFKKLERDYNLNYDRLIDEYRRLSPYPEAGIVPETYHIPIGMDERGVIRFLISESEKIYENVAVRELKSYDRRLWLIYLTIASIIQKEAASVDEMPKISSVIYNRLKRGMPLQMDGTLNYGLYSHVRVTPERIREDRSPFNTYLNRGIPPYPVSSVSIDAIISAIHPEETDFLFFVKNRDGKHDFSRSYREHLRNIERAKR
ncbi:MAG: endolytic transglycosylase MltG [Epsilonproteobacteria bacterium]|nr:endolytic transglycosylase MltG [Campylobacterota bacterium]